MYWSGLLLSDSVLTLTDDKDNNDIIEPECDDDHLFDKKFKKSLGEKRENGIGTSLIKNHKAWLATNFDLPNSQLRNTKAIHNCNHTQLAFLMVAKTKATAYLKFSKLKIKKQTTFLNLPKKNWMTLRYFEIFQI